MPTPRWKLSDDLSEASLNYDDASSLGEFFATAIAEGISQNKGPKKATYNRFRTTFWEEPLYNPEILHGHINHAHEYLEKEQHRAWDRPQPKWSLSSDVRFRDNVYTNPGPQKPERFPNCFEKPHKYWGRQRKINPFARAKVYTRPNDRCKPWVKLTLLEEMADLGPGRYDIPDEWAKAIKPVCGVVRPSSFMASKAPKGVPVKPAVGQEGYDNSSTEFKGDQPINAALSGSQGGNQRWASKSSQSKTALRSGFSFPRGAKNALDDMGPADLPVYHIRVRDITTGQPCIMAVNSLTNPLPEGFVNQETWAHENLDGGVSLTLKKEPLPPLNPLAHDISTDVPDVALVPMPVTPLKKSKPCSPIEVKQLHLTTGTDVLMLSPNSSPHPRTSGGYLPTAMHSLQMTTGSRLIDHSPADFDAAGVVDWNHPIAKLHIPTTVTNRSTTTASSVRPKTHGQKLHVREARQVSTGPQSQEPFSAITNRTRPDGSKFKKIPMHVADLASIDPKSTSLEASFSPQKSSSLQEDSLGARSVGKKLRDSIVQTASVHNSTLLNSLSQSCL